MIKSNDNIYIKNTVYETLIHITANEENMAELFMKKYHKISKAVCLIKYRSWDIYWD